MDSSKPRYLPWLLLIAAVLLVAVIVCAFSAILGAGALLWNAQRTGSTEENSLNSSELGALTSAAGPDQARLQPAQGIVEAQDTAGNWSTVAGDQLLSAGGTVRTGELSSAVLTFPDGSQVVLGPGTQISIQELGFSDGLLTVVLEQKTGESRHRIVSTSESKINYEVHTPTGSAAAHGTQFSVSIASDRGARFAVEEGSVTVSGSGEAVVVEAGQVSTVAAGEPPSPPAMHISGEGAVSQIGDSWIIAGQTFTVHEATLIIGDPHVGDIVHVEGRLLADNTRLADLIYLLRASPANRFTLTGEVQEIGDEAWQIAGQTVVISTTTQIDPGIEIGSLVRAEGVILENGGLQATRIVLYSQQDGYPFEFTGVVEAISDGTWTISGKSISVDEGTVIAEGLGVGDIVRVSGRILPDDSWLASRILPALGDMHTFEISGRLESMQPWRVAGIAFETREWTDIQPGLEMGDLVVVQGVIQEDGTWVAYEISSVEETPYPLIVIIGTVISVDPWVVSGIPLNVTDETIIEGDISPGMLVRVEIYLLPDGTWQVIRITSLDVFTGIPGCMNLTATVIGVEGNILRLLGWPKLELDEDIRVEGDLKPDSIVLIQLCFDADGHLTIIVITIIFQPDDEIEPPSIGDKVTICHKPLKKKGGNTITVSRSALPAHLGHGDYIGACSP
jgi:hypothetical protein